MNDYMINKISYDDLHRICLRKACEIAILKENIKSAIEFIDISINLLKQNPMDGDLWIILKLEIIKNLLKGE